MLITNWVADPESSHLLRDYYAKDDGCVDFEKQFGDNNRQCPPLKIVSISDGRCWINSLEDNHVSSDRILEITDKYKLGPGSDPDFQQEWFSALFGYSPRWKMVGCQLTSFGLRLIFIDYTGESHLPGEVILDDWDGVVGLVIAVRNYGYPRHFTVFLTRGRSNHTTTFVYGHVNYAFDNIAKIIWGENDKDYIVI